MPVPLQPVEETRTLVYEVPCPHGCVVPVQVTIIRAGDGRILGIIVKH